MSFRPAFDNWKWKQGVSQLTGEVHHLTHDVATSLREKQVESTTKREQLRVMTNTLQQSQCSLQYEIKWTKQDKQEENKTQSDCFSSNEQLRNHISELWQDPQNDLSELQEENCKLKLKIESKDEEIARMQKETVEIQQKQQKKYHDSPTSKLCEFTCGDKVQVKYFSGKKGKRERRTIEKRLGPVTNLVREV